MRTERSRPANHFTVRVESIETRDSYAILKLEGGRLAARIWAGIRKGEMAAVRIRPEDVLLAAEPPGRVSARNVLPGHVAAVRHVPEGVLVTIDVGFRLAALVTRRAVRDLKLRRGTAVYALVKSSAVLPLAFVAPAFLLSAVGKRGVIGHEKLDFLGAIERCGTLSAAARDAGISYRTAWLWIESMNRAWGSSLVERIHGGKGGGGTVLSPEGRALLERVESSERLLHGGAGARPPRKG
jgi:molybdate transport repressor ModE-like protein/molybdopterin-binding protein